MEWGGFSIDDVLSTIGAHFDEAYVNDFTMFDRIFNPDYQCDELGARQLKAKGVYKHK